MLSPFVSQTASLIRISLHNTKNRGKEALINHITQRCCCRASCTQLYITCNYTQSHTCSFSSSYGLKAIDHNKVYAQPMHCTVVWAFLQRNHSNHTTIWDEPLLFYRLTTSHLADWLPSVDCVSEPRGTHRHRQTLGYQNLSFTVSGCEQLAVHRRLTDILYCLVCIYNRKLWGETNHTATLKTVWLQNAFYFIVWSKM